MKEFKVGDRVVVLDHEEMLEQDPDTIVNCGTVYTRNVQTPGFVIVGMDHLCGETGMVVDTEYIDGIQVKVFVNFDNDKINRESWHYAPFMFMKIDDGVDDLPELLNLYGGLNE